MDEQNQPPATEVQASLPASEHVATNVVLDTPVMDQCEQPFDSNSSNPLESTDSKKMSEENSYCTLPSTIQGDSLKKDAQMAEDQYEPHPEPSEMDCVSLLQTEGSTHDPSDLPGSELSESMQTDARTDNIEELTGQPTCEVQPTNADPSSEILSNSSVEASCLITNDLENANTEPVDQPVLSTSKESSVHTHVEASQESADTADNAAPVCSQGSQVSTCQQVEGTDSAHDPVSVGNPSHDQPMEDVLTTEPQQSTVTDSGYRFSSTNIPQVVWESQTEFERSPHENFLRGCKWAPDGSILVANSNDNYLRVYSNSLYRDVSDTSEPKSDVIIREGSQIYDFCWLTGESHVSMGTLRVACTCSGIPVHLWDATSGQHVASYLAYDQNDEITAAYSLSFSCDGSKLYCGFNKAIRLFDTERPGRFCSTIPTYNSKTKHGVTGIISCFAHCPNSGGFYAVGSYNRYVGIYDSHQNQLVSVMEGQRGGITHIQFSPDGTKLYTGGRKDPEILCWDLRSPRAPLFSVLRDVKTNQRMYFDLTQSGRYLCSGNHDGSVSVWDTCAPPEEVDGDMFLKPHCQFQGHADCVNAISFNHQHHLLATGSGQRHFQNLDQCFSSDSSQSEDEDFVEPKKDFSLKLWSIPLEASLG